MKTPKDVGERVTLCKDGKYRWVYEMDMLKNPSILFDIWKVFGITIAIMVGMALIIGLLSGDLDLKMLAELCQSLGIVVAAIAVVSTLGYLLYAAITGWKYVVLFIMDESNVVHQQMPSQVKKGQVIGALTTLAGMASGKPGMVGTGLLAQSRTSMTTALANVERLIPCRSMNLIKVNQLLEKNRVYVPGEDFDFVYDFLCKHCVKAKKD